MQKNRLQEHFPMLKNREELLSTIDKRKNLARLFYSWDEKYQKEFLDFCSGAKGCKMLYDSFVKELLNPELYPERLNELLLRQYKSVRAESGTKKFSYRDIKDVYTIVFLEKCGKLFHQYPDEYLQYFEQESKLGLKLELLQKYIFAPIDIFLKREQIEL